MSVPSRKETDALITELNATRNPVWESLAASKGFNVKDMQKAIFGYERPNKDRQLTEAATYFVEEIKKYKSASEQYHFNELIKEPGSHKFALNLSSQRYSERAMQGIRTVSTLVLEYMRNKFGETSEEYDDMLAFMCQLVAADEIIRISEMLNEFDDTRR